MTQTERARPRTRRRARVSPITAIISATALIGLILLLYPGIASWFTQYEQALEIDQYSGVIRDLGPNARTEAIDAAHAYNEQLADGSSVVAANERKPLAGEGAEADALYQTLLNADDEGLMARIRIPSIDADLPIFHGTSDDILTKGIGHLEGTALPVGGVGTHSVLTGHRGLATAELFDNLDKVEVGDTFTIEVFGDILTYKVTSTTVVEPEDTETLYPQPGHDLVTLITCTPLGINSHRILVTGERLIPTPTADVDAAGAHPDVPKFPWWAVGLGAGVLVIGGYTWFSSRPRRVPVAALPPDVDVRDDDPDAHRGP
jgi:sortase A